MVQTPYTDPFWEALADGDFRIHRCKACQSTYFPPGPVCPHCQSTAVEWEASTGAGTLFSFTRQHATASGFDDQLLVGVVDLDDGPRVLTAIEGSFDDLEIGDRMQLEPTEYTQAFDRERLEDAPFFVAVPR